jgi:phenylalanyl-tRNA synthetase alpha chain
LVEISQNETRVLRTLIDSGGKSSLEDLSKKSGLADSAVARAVLNLSQNQLVNERVEKETELSLTDEGRTFARVGLPERIILLEVKNHGGRLTLKEALQHSKLAEKYGSIATGWINRKKWGTIEKSGPDLVIVARSEAPIDDDEEVLARLRKDVMILEELSPSLRDAALRLTKRNLVESRIRNDRQVEITEAGRNIGTTAPSPPEVSSLTGKYHPYLRFLRMVRRKLVALGFREAVGPLVETAFINCDCLYMPQDHPAREIHDLYYLKEPSRASLEEYGSLVDRVAQTHENGWKTGSTGWRYKFSRDEASKLILRSHGTALSVRTMLSKDLQIPGKYFAIARCFRPDMLDKTHLTEFNQAEGIVLDPSLNLRNLLGILEMFAKEVAGADKVRFKPDYFPFTEPSVELQAYREGFGWMEFGGSGMFRPEVTEPLGVHVPVLAWGLGIDRLYMMSRKIQDIRQLFTSDLEWIREQAVG